MKKASLCGIFIIILFGFSGANCKKRNFNSDVKTVEEDSKKASFSLENYVERCKSYLGEIPQVKCLEGNLLRIYARSGDKTGELGKDIPYDKNAICLNANLAGPERCIVGQRVGKVASPSGHPTQWMFICRREVFLPEDDARFGSVGLIGHNPENGATCFFDTRRNYLGDLENPVGAMTKLSEIKADNLPSPDISKHPELKSKALAQNRNPIWMEPSEMNNDVAFQCVRCHSTYPWIRGASINHATAAAHFGISPSLQGNAPVPENFSDHPKAAFEKKYWVVAQNELNKASEEGWWTPYKIVKTPETQACLSCHRLGGNGSNLRLAAASVGYCVDKVCPQFDEAAKKLPFANWHRSLFKTKFPDLDTPEKFNASRQKAAIEYVFKNCFMAFPNLENCPREIHDDRPLKEK